MRSVLFIVFVLLSTSIFAQKPNEKPAWNVTLKAGANVASTITVQNRCKKSHTFEIRGVSVPFLTFDSTEVKVKGGKNKIVPVRFNTTGLAPKKYEGKVLVICETCKKEPTCTQDRETLPVVLTVPGETMENKDPYKNFNFKIEIDGIGEGGKTVAGSFTEASGLSLETTPIEYRSGCEDVTVRKIPGIKKFGNITLKRGFIHDIAFWKWIETAVDGTVKRKAGSIKLLDENGKPAGQFIFKSAWPCKWSGPALDSRDGEMAIEVLEIAHEGLEFKKYEGGGAKKP